MEWVKSVRRIGKVGTYRYYSAYQLKTTWDISDADTVLEQKNSFSRGGSEDTGKQVRVICLVIGHYWRGDSSSYLWDHTPV